MSKQKPLRTALAAVVATRRTDHQAGTRTPGEATSHSPTAGDKVGRKNRPDRYAQVSMYLDRAIHKRLRVAAAELERDQVECIEEALTQWLDATDTTRR